MEPTRAPAIGLASADAAAIPAVTASAAHFRIAPWTEYVEIYWGDGCQIYAISGGIG